MSASSSPPLGLRERNKQRRRDTIISCAYALFAEHGYAATTIADIAAAADIAPRTVSLYFPTKQDIVLDGVLGMITPLSDRLERLQPGESVIEALLLTLGEQVKESWRPELEHLPGKLKSDPEIYGIITATVENLEQSGVRAIARELDVDPADVRVQVTLAALRGVVEHAMFVSDENEIDEIIASGIAFLQAGISRISPANS